MGGVPIIHSPVFQGILQNPADIEFRLIFADWLEDQGDIERAEFIRLQCASSSDPFQFQRGDNLEESATEHEKELFAAHRRQWVANIYRFLLNSPMREVVQTRRLRKICEWSYRRGLIEQLRINTRVFVDHYETLFQLGPILHLRIRNMEAPLEEFLTCPRLSQIQSLDISSQDWLSDDQVASLVKCRNLGQLTDLIVSPIIGQTHKTILKNGMIGAPFYPNLKRIWHVNYGTVV